jgi:SAM-dependent methyltransferase
VASASPSCPACGADLSGASSFAGVDRLHRTPGSFEVLICGRCGSGATRPPAGPADLASFYPDAYGPYDPTSGRVLGAISRAIRWWQGRRALAGSPLAALAAAPPGRLVDVGCGRGDLAGLFMRRGWRATGIEPSPNAAEAAAAQGIDVRVGTLADVALESDAYDAAVFQHSLEHTLDPVGDLKRVRASLQADGRVAITVPNFASWQRRRFRDRWFHLDLPRHRSHFTPRGLTAALERSGFAVEEIATSTSSVGLPGSIQYALAGRCLFPGGLPLRVASGLCVLVLPLARVLDRRGGGGDQLHAVARAAMASSTSAPTASAGAG